jgi:hypothetical protein
MSPVAVSIGSLVILGVGAILTTATTRVSEVKPDPALGRGRIAAATGILATIAGVVGIGIAIYLFLFG